MLSVAFKEWAVICAALAAAGTAMPLHLHPGQCPRAP